MTGLGVYVDVLDASGNVLGNPIMTALSVSVSRILDGAGSISVSFPANDKRVTDLIANERRLKIYYWQDGKVTRNVGTMIARRLRWSGPSGGNLMVDGPSEIAELKDINTYRNYSYGNPSGATIQSVIDGLLALSNGWTSNVESAIASNLISGRFEGFSVLRALQYIANQTGYHFRQTAGSKVIEFGAFGADTGITLIKPQHMHPSLNDNDNIGIITAINVSEDSENIINTLVPLGGGEGSAAVTLDDSDRITPYTITDISGQGAQTFKGLIHSASVATYGTRAKVLAFKNIAPIANSAAAKLLAGNALYDAGVAYLDRNATPQSTYACSVFKVNQALAEGDKIHLTINEMVQTFNPTGQSEQFIPKNVDADFWIMDVTERIDQSGSSYTMNISDIDKREESLEKTIIGSIENAELNNLVVKTFPYVFNDSWTDHVQYGNPATSPTVLGTQYTAYFELVIPDIVTDVISVKIRIKTLRAVSQGINASNLSRSLLSLTRVGLLFNKMLSAYYPPEIDLSINGTNVTSALGGPWGTPTASLEQELDITEYITGASGGLYQTHTLELNCGTVTGNVSYSTFADASGVNDVLYIPSDSTVAPPTGRIQLSVQILGVAQAILPA